MRRTNRSLFPWALMLLATDVRADSLNGLRSSVAPVGDVNGDGIPDLAVASRDRDRPDRVWVVSGKDGSKLLEIAGRPPAGSKSWNPKDPPTQDGERFGSTIGAIGDWDHDGTPDLYVDAHRKQASRGDGYRRLISGKTGAVLSELDDSGAVGGTRDLDGDGLGDLLLVLGPRKRNGSSHVVVLSGKDRSDLLSVPVDSDEAIDGEPVVESLAWVDDVDRDGRCDFAAALSFRVRIEGKKSSHTATEFTVRSGRTGLALWSAPLDEHGGGGLVRLPDANADGVDDVLCVLEDQYVRLLGGKDGATIWEHSLKTHVCYSLGSSLDRCGDVDRDGVEDWIVAANESWGDFFDAGLCHVFSGKTGQFIRGPPEEQNFGYDACGLGDVDGDGVPDFVVGAERQRGWTPDDSSEPAVQVRSGKDASILWMRRHVDLRK